MGAALPERGVRLSFSEPKSKIQASSLCTVFKLTGGEGYVEYNFSGALEASKEIYANFPAFQLKIEIEDSSSKRLAGGLSLHEIYFLSLYSNPISVSKGNKAIKDHVSPEIDDQTMLGSRRYFDFSYVASPPSLQGSSMLVLETPFGKDLGSHCWDCAWVGLDFLSRLILAPKELASEKYVLNFDLANALRDAILDPTSSEMFLELGSGCGLLSLGLASILNEFNPSFQERQLPRNQSFNFLLSDLAAVLPSCRRNILANFTIDGLPTTKLKRVAKKINLGLTELQWEAPLNQDISLNPRVIFAFDVVYNDAAHMPLFTVLKNLVRISSKAESTYILLGYKQRSQRVEKGFFDLVRPCFSLTRILFHFGILLLLLKPIPGASME
ncbi:hypothetical protein DSO57_1001337 [Entomophthora muscae]|nr:hypothetical protein DSO57_1001337 [Entomophthora muscae]